LAVVEMSKWFFWSRVTPGVDLNEILQYSSSHYALSTSNIFGPCVGGLALLLTLVGDAAEVGECNSKRADGLKRIWTVQRRW
jgi:hypothetical protein